MSVFEKNGMLQRQDQIRLKEEEQRILGSNLSDGQKTVQVDNLYRQRGLEPGSFYRADFDRTGPVTHDSGDASDFGIGVKFIVWLLVFWGGMTLGLKYAPRQTEAVWRFISWSVQIFLDIMGQLFSYVLK